MTVEARGGWFNLQTSTSCTVKNFALYAPSRLRAYDGYAATPLFLGGIAAGRSHNGGDGGTGGWPRAFGSPVWTTFEVSKPANCPVGWP